MRAIGVMIGVWMAMLCAVVQADLETDMKLFQKVSELNWKEILRDPCTEGWNKHWTLDGRKATITHSDKGMDFTAGPVWGDDSCHAVMWSKQSYKGDIRIDYEYTRLDKEIRGVTILYLQATGSGEGPHKKDVAEWANLREVPSMGRYFNNMNTLHISYAAWDTRNEDPAADYIRVRRYMPLAKKGLRDTGLEPDYLETDLFKTGVPHKITVIKKGNDLFMHIRNGKQEKLCHWKTDAFPPIVEGRIGLRHMYTRSARYRNFRVSMINQK